MRTLDRCGAPVSALIVIPARLGSTRLPRKPLRELGGRPLIVRVLERVLALKMDGTVVVATDDESVAESVRAAGGTAVRTSADHPSGTDRVAEVARLAEYRDFDVIINVQGDEPFVSGEAVNSARAQVEVLGHPIGTVACTDSADVLEVPSVVKVVRDSAGRALYFSRAPIPFLRDDSERRERDELVLRHVGIYAYTRDALMHWVSLPPTPLERVERLEQLRPLYAGIAIGVGLSSEPAAGGIDTEDDLARANASWPAPAVLATSPVPAGNR
ncbi:MAG: 3-deoxy-manno-octulosonate cytidylyltransferase [Gemmatimonadetes bacterium]|nr:3-deoxy-manno-octulosonate cytidylyltransferase [Gemmatimonadota bacterium]